PFSEFLWADFFRRKIKRKAVEADSPPRWSKRCAWREAKRRNICRAGADPRPTRDRANNIRSRYRALGFGSAGYFYSITSSARASTVGGIKPQCVWRNF